MKPKGFLVEWYRNAAYSFFRTSDMAEMKKIYLQDSGFGDVVITPVYESSDTEKLTAIRTALADCLDTLSRWNEDIGGLPRKICRGADRRLREKIEIILREKC